MQLFNLVTLLVFYVSIVLTVDNQEAINNARGVKRLLIFPGTKWCGPGNKAEHDHDFGSNREVDICCRNHDRCRPKIAAGEMKYGVVNNGRTSLLSCSCDAIFLDCLKAINSWTSRLIGNAYFNVLRRQCFHYVTENNDGTFSKVNVPKFTNDTIFRFFSFFS